MAVSRLKMMDTEQRFVFDKLDFCRIAGEQRELNGRKSWPDDTEGGLVLRIVDDCFDYELKLLPRIVSDSITPPAPRPVLPRTRASPPGDWYCGPSAFLRLSWSHHEPLHYDPIRLRPALVSAQ